MRYLVDTHTLVWAIYNPGQLSRTVGDILTDGESVIYASSVSFWEIAIKHSIGKAILSETTPDALPQIARTAGFEILTLTDELLATSYRLEFIEGHRDPFDRLIIWQAVQSGFGLLSKDSHFPGYEEQGLRLVW
jgi:PIN domain nuclease of toxin-antitoxin system